MFADFDFEILNDPFFKEDSVREELILPIIKSLGYSLNGDARIIRSKPLVHPYVAIGSQRKMVSIIPDYIFMSNNKPYWILDAKSPNENILKSKHVEQAYSYAIHPEVRAELYALCNGRDFVLYSVGCFEPVLYFKLKDINAYWSTLFRILNPEIMASPELTSYHPDYGLHLRKLGAPEGFQIVAFAVHTNHIAKIEDGLYTTNTVFYLENQYVASLDFNEEKLNKLLEILPEKNASILFDGLKKQPYQVFLEQDEFKFGVSAQLNRDVIHNAEESYISFQVDDFMSYYDFGCDISK